MKFSCPKCKKEFSLSTDRLQSGVMRFRCTSCNSVIRMRLAGSAPEAGGTSAPTGSSTGLVGDTAPDMKSVVGPQYYAVIAKTKVGPMPFAALKRLITERKIARNTLVWFQGLTAWTMAGAVNELKDLFPPVEPVAQPQPEKSVAAPRPDGVPKPAPPPPPPPPKPVPTVAKPQEAPKPVARPLEQKADASQDDATYFPPAPTVREESSPRLDEAASSVGIDAIDQQFFDAASAGEVAHDKVRSRMQEIEVAEAPMFPTVEVEALRPSKAAGESLRDFSVMVRLSRQSRRRTLLVVAAGAAAMALAVGLIFALGDSSKVKDKARKIEDNISSNVSDDPYFKGNGNGTPVSGQQQSDQDVVRGDASDQPAAHPRVSLDSQVVAPRVDYQKFTVAVDIGDSIPIPDLPQANRNGQTAGTGPKGSRPSQHERSFQEAAIELAQNNADKAGQGSQANQGGAGTGQANVGSRLKIKSGTGADDSNDQLVDPEEIIKKVRGIVVQYLEEHHHQVSECGRRYVLKGKSMAYLHFDDRGSVTRVSIQDAGPGAEECFLNIFKGFSVDLITVRTKVPVRIDFN